MTPEDRDKLQSLTSKYFELIDQQDNLRTYIRALVEQCEHKNIRHEELSNTCQDCGAVLSSKDNKPLLMYENDSCKRRNILLTL